jgi:hypothetical protein
MEVLGLCFAHVGRTPEFITKAALEVSSHDVLAVTSNSDSRSTLQIRFER